MTITLPDGYNGHTLRFAAEPIAVAGNSVKLHVAEPGKEYLIRWTHKDDYLLAIGKAFEHIPLNMVGWLLDTEDSDAGHN
jgi:hypothetical protein